jgi:hypothetical protein
VRRAALTAIQVAGLVVAQVAHAIPPPPDREPRVVTLAPGRAVRVDDLVLAYDHPVFAFDARRGERLLVQLEDPTSTLMVALEAPSGARVLDGARPAAGGLQMLLNESGRWRVSVLMDGDAARRGARASFALSLERR